MIRAQPLTCQFLDASCSAISRCRSRGSRTSPRALRLGAQLTLVVLGFIACGATAYAAPAGTFTAIAAGYDFNLGLRVDGTLVGWGRNSSDQIYVPTGVFTAIAAGSEHSLGLRADGTVAAWGSNGDGQTNVPAGTFTAIAAGEDHNLALRAFTVYDGDLSVRYSGAPSGFNGLKANLNRSITVAGDAIIASPMFLYNNPTMTVAGNVLLESAGEIEGAGAIDGRVIGQAGSAIVATGSLSLGKADHLLGFSTAGDLNAGAQTVTLRSGGFATLGGATSLGGGTIAAAGGVLIAPGASLQGHGTISGKVAVAIGATLEATGNLTLGSSGVNGFFSEGALRVHGHTVTIHDSHQAVLGSHTSLGSMHIEPFPIFQPAADYGTLTAAGGSLLEEGRSLSGWGTVNGAFKNEGVVAAVSPPAVLGLREHDLTFTGAVSGSGPIFGDVLFEGSYSPGNSPAQVQLGSMTLAPEATLILELGGLAAGTQHDTLIATAATLNGRLQLDLISGYAPQLGDTFDVISTTGGVTGTFSEIVPPASLPAGLRFDVLYAPTQVQLAVVSAFAADFDNDGDVDGADLTEWRNDFGPTAGSDADGDGDSDGADFLAWQQQLGSGTPLAAASRGVLAPGARIPGASVPEPTAARIAGAAIACFTTYRRRKSYA